jgi:glycosyltransferase involved in cell wall biosynthesis
MSPSISVLLLASEAAETIAPTVKGAFSELTHITNDFEIIVINNGSRDGTRDVLCRLEGHVPNLSVLHHAYHRSPKTAIARGLERATKDFVFFTDADGRYDIHELRRFLRKLRPNIDVLQGYRIDYPRRGFHTWLDGAYRRSPQRILSLPLHDVHCNFRLIRRSALDAVCFGGLSGDLFWVDLIRKMDALGFNMIEAPVTYVTRRTAPHSASDILEFLHDITKLYVLWWSPAVLPPDNNAAQISAVPDRKPK